MQPALRRIGPLVGILTGALLVALGVFGVAAYPGPEFELDPELWQDRPDGSVAIYQEVESGPDYQRYEHAPIDASSTAVYAVDESLDVRVEVLRGTSRDAEAFPRVGTDEVVFGFDLVHVDATTDVVFLIDEERGVRTEVYRGDDGEAWYHTRAQELVFEGTSAEAEAWVDAQPVPGAGAPISMWIAVGGLVTIVAGVSLVWPRTPKPLGFGIVVVAVGLLPSSVPFVIMDAVHGESEEWKLSVGVMALLAAVAGGLTGAVTGISIGRRDEPPRTETAEPKQPMTVQ